MKFRHQSGTPPNSAVQSFRGTIWHSTGRFKPTGQRAGS
jgi:hypothetical protein